MDHPFALDGVLQGYMPLRRARGTCLVAVDGPSLWPFAARALGFTVKAIAAPSGTWGGAFSALMAEFEPEAELIEIAERGRGRRLGDRRRLDLQVDFICGDATATPTWDNSYWTARPVVHALSSPAGWSPPPSARHATTVQSFQHNEVGGCTTAEWQLAVYVPLGLAAPPTGRDPPARLPETTIGGVLDSLTAAVGVGEPPAPTAYLPGTVHVEGEAVLSHGLFPGQNWNQQLICPAVFNASNWGRRRMTPVECAKACDAPILAVDALEKRIPNAVGTLRALAEGPPGKILLVGVDRLLTVGVRGGWLRDEDAAEAGLRAAEAGDDAADSASRRVGAEDGRPNIPGDTARESFQQHIDEVLRELETSEEEVVKRDERKADDAEVPVGMWDRFYLLDRKHLTLEGGKLPGRLPSSWRKHLNVLRGFFLRVYRRRLFRSFIVFQAQSVSSSSPSGTGKKRKRKGTADTIHIIAAGYSAWLEQLADPQARVAFPVPARQLSGTVVRRDAPGLPWGFRYEWTRKARGRERYCEWHEALGRAVPGRSIAAECLTRAADATWWEWKGGSTLVFWKWPRGSRSHARQGQPHFMTGDPPRFRRRQRPPQNESARAVMKSKVDKFRSRGYVRDGTALGIVHMFAVPKGLHDWRMVFDATGSGLNAVLWSPHFGLPTVRCTFRSLLPGYWQCDMDVGEMFLCFWLHTMLRKYTGIDVSHVRTPQGERRPSWEEGRNRPWEHWVRNCMGLRDSPARSLMLMIRAKFIAYGDRRDPTNPFSFSRVVLNLPGSVNYDPSKPWVAKLRADGEIACEVYIYVDDGRLTGPSKSLCWKAARRLCSVLNGQGVQDAARKRSEPSQTPGPWAGSVTHTNDEVRVTVSAEKWAKAKAQVRELAAMADSGQMNLHRLRQIRGFLGYFVRTYRWGNPYLKGLHLTIDGWRSGCDPETGWKRPVKFRSTLIQDEESGDWIEDERVDEPAAEPEFVKPAPRLVRDLTCLGKLLEGDVPARESVRASTTAAGYLLGDASGLGFGSGLFDGKGVAYEAASWTPVYQANSSNWREACNLTDRVLRLAQAGELRGGEVFVFTDNTTFESSFYKGYSVSEKLSDLTFKLRCAEREAGCIIHVIHIAGTRMKESGIDGLSRGDMFEGIMKGENPLRFIPLDTGAIARSQGRVLTWVNSWWNDPTEKPYLGAALRLLEPTDWFELYDIAAPRLWSPPPAAMETVVELFNEDRLAHPEMSHVFVVPRLMTHLFRRSLGKDADLMFEAASGSWFWPLSMHEPLIVIIVLPLVHVPRHHGPWVLRSSELSNNTAKELKGGFKHPEVWGQVKLHDLDCPVPSLRTEAGKGSGPVLREFLDTARTKHPPLSHGLLRGLLHHLPERSIPNPRQAR